MDSSDQNQDVPRQSLDELYQNIYQAPGVPFNTWENLPILTDKVSMMQEDTSNILFPNFSLFPYNPYNNFSDLSPLANFDSNMDNSFSFEGIPVSIQYSHSSTSHYSSGSESMNLNSRHNMTSCSPPQGALGLPTINEALSSSQMNFKEEDSMDLIEKYFNLDPELPSEFSSQDTSLPFNPVEATVNPKVPIKRLKSRAKKEPKAREKKTKTSHMVIEQKYRNSLIFGINELKNELPFAPRPEGKGLVALGDIEPPSKLNKSTVLRKATEYIQELKRNNSRLEQQNSRFKEALRLIPGGFEMISDIESETSSGSSDSPNTTESLSSSPASRFLMASFLLITFWKVPSNASSMESFSSDQSKASSVFSFSLVTIATIFCLFALVTSNTLQNFLGFGKAKKSSSFNIDSELECLDKKSNYSSILLFFKQLYFLTYVFIQKYIPFLNYQADQSIMPSSKLLNYTLLNYISTKESLDWSSSIETLFYKFSFILIIIRSVLISNPKSRPDLLISLSLMTLSLIPDSSLRTRISQYLLNEVGKLSGYSLLASSIFFEWLVNLPVNQSVTLSTETETDSLLIWVSRKYHAFNIDQLAKSYLSKPDQTPSLQPVLEQITKDKLSLVNQPSLILALQLEATFAFSNGHNHYAELLTSKLAQQFLNNPNCFSSETKVILEGLMGCMLSLEGPHRDIHKASLLLDKYLSNTNPSKFSSSIEFFVSHLFLTTSLTLYELKLSERNDLSYKLDTADASLASSVQSLQSSNLTNYIHELRLNLYKIPLARLKCLDNDDQSKTEFRHMMTVHYQSVAKWLASNGPSLSLTFNSSVI